MTWPDTIKDTVLYNRKEYIADQQQTLRMIDSAKAEFIGDLSFYGNLTVSGDVIHDGDVRNYGAKGDGVTDDKNAIQAALNAASVNGGLVYFPPGKVFATSGGLTYDLANTTYSNPLTLEAYGATIKLLTSTNTTLITITRNNMNALIPAPFVKGGRWINTSGGTGNTCFLFRDIGPRMEDVVIRDFSQGKGIYLQNWYGWSEQSRIINCSISGVRHAIYFSDGADSGGPSGTTSFARTQVLNMGLSGGEAGYGLIRTTGNVYHSSFIGLWGNLTGGEHIFQDNGASGSFNGSRIFWSGFEGMTAGTYFYYRPDGAWPTNRPDIYGFDQIGTNMALTNLSDPEGNLATTFPGRLMIAGFKAGSLGAEWGLAIGGGKNIISGRHPSGSNPNGTRMTWLEILTTDELVIGGSNASRSPAATMLGRFAPVKICAPLQQVGFFDVTPVGRQASVTARAALEAYGLGQTLTPELRPTVTLATVTSTATLPQANSYIRFTGASPSYTLPANSVIAFPINTEISGTCTTGTMTIVQGAGAVVNKARTLVTTAAFSGWTAIKVATDEWDIHGDFV